MGCLRGMASKIKHHERKGPWQVVEMTQRWKKQKIKRGAKPTVQFHTLLEAVTHAHGLAEAKAGSHFAVFECIGYVENLEKPLAKEKPESETPNVRS